MRIHCVSNEEISCFLFRRKHNGHACLQGSFSEIVSIGNLGMAKTGPMVEDSGSLLLEYVNGSACTTSDGRRTTYTTRIHLVCSRGSLVRKALLVTHDLGCFGCLFTGTKVDLNSASGQHVIQTQGGKEHGDGACVAVPSQL